MSIASVRSAITTALQTVTDQGSPAIRLNASAYITDHVTTPHAMFDMVVNPHMVFGDDKAVYELTVWVYVSRGDDEAGQKFLDLMRDPTTTTSLPHILENNSTLAAAVDYVKFVRAGFVELAAVSGAEYLMVPFEFEVCF